MHVVHTCTKHGWLVLMMLSPAPPPKAASTGSRILLPPPPPHPAAAASPASRLHTPLVSCSGAANMSVPPAAQCGGTSMAAAWQQHGSSMAAAWQSQNGSSMAEAERQQHGRGSGSLPGGREGGGRGGRGCSAPGLEANNTACMPHPPTRPPTCRQAVLTEHATEPAIRQLGTHAAAVAPRGIAASQQHILQATERRDGSRVDGAASASLRCSGCAMWLQLQLHLTVELLTGAETDPWLNVHVNNCELVQKGDPTSHIQRQPTAPAPQHAMQGGSSGVAGPAGRRELLAGCPLAGMQDGPANLSIWWPWPASASWPQGLTGGASSALGHPDGPAGCRPPAAL